MIYLDNAATTLKKPPEVKQAVVSAMENCTSVGRGGYKEAMNAAECVYTARERAARLFGAQLPECICFTYNATYALNMAIKGLAKKGNCVISGYEHNSVVRPLHALKNIKVKIARGALFDEEDMIKKFRQSIDKNTNLAVFTHVSNVFGYILPIYEIDEICKKRGIPLVIDASQSAGSVPLNMKRLQAAECICAPGHKGLYGPQGTGLLICKNNRELKTITEGGTGSMSSEPAQPGFLPDRFESGTQNVPGIAGLAEGISYVLKKKPQKILKHERDLIELAASEIRKIHGMKVWYSKEKRLQSGVLSFVSDRISQEKLAENLGEKEIAVRSGMHCAPLAHSTVGTLNGTVRVSVSDFTHSSDIEALISALKSI